MIFYIYDDYFAEDEDDNDKDGLHLHEVLLSSNEDANVDNFPLLPFSKKVACSYH
jgi:hypothetical protein